MNKKITILILSFAVISILAVVSFWIVWDTRDNGGNENQNVNQNTNQADNGEIDTSDWLTYRNEEYGYSIKYPRDWTLREFSDTKTGADFIGDNCKIIIDAGGARAKGYLDMSFEEYI